MAKTRNPGYDPHANDHGHVRVYAWLGNAPCTVQTEQLTDLSCTDAPGGKKAAM